MEDRKRDNGMEGTLSELNSTGKKPWRTPNLTEVDYRETRASGSVSPYDDGVGGYS